MKQHFYNFTVHINEKDKMNPVVNIEFHGCKSVKDAEELAEYLNIILNLQDEPQATNLH